MHKDFIQALNKLYNCNSKDELSGLDLQHYNFAESTNKRAVDAIGVFLAYGFNLDKLRILDVGCAYGGFSIEAAKRGAYSVGIEISKKLYDFAVINNKDEVYDKGNARFFLADATSPEILQTLPLNYFDLIIVNDVFEHIYDTVQLLSNLSKLAADHASIYFTVPNGLYMQYVAKEGHTGEVGLSILAPLRWHLLTGDRGLNIYYRQWEYYEALFNFFGFNQISVTNYPGYAERQSSISLLSNELEQMQKNINENIASLPEKYVNILNESISSYINQYKYDLKNLDSAKLVWKYGTKFWAGFANKSGNNDISIEKKLSYNRLKQTTLRQSNSDNVESIHTVFSIKGNICSVEVSCDFDISDYEFAFHLMRRGESIQRGRYKKEPKQTYELKSTGMYYVGLFVKHKDHEHKDYRIVTHPLYYIEDIDVHN